MRRKNKNIFNFKRKNRIKAHKDIYGEVGQKKAGSGRYVLMILFALNLILILSSVITRGSVKQTV